MEKRIITRGGRFLNNSIRTTIFIYFTVTALAAGLLITFPCIRDFPGRLRLWYRMRIRG